MFGRLVNGIASSGTSWPGSNSKSPCSSLTHRCCIVQGPQTGPSHSFPCAQNAGIQPSSIASSSSSCRQQKQQIIVCPLDCLPLWLPRAFNSSVARMRRPIVARIASCTWPSCSTIHGQESAPGPRDRCRCLRGTDGPSCAGAGGDTA